MNNTEQCTDVQLTRQLKGICTLHDMKKYAH